MAYDNITGSTVLTGLLGSPVAHSISPAMHNEAFRILGLDYVYLAFDVPESRLGDAVSGLRAMGVRGFNLTMPDKNLMCDYCDELSQASLLTGSVNTVVNDNGILKGYTTDGIGFMKSAEEAGHDLKGKTMTILGGGGASTAICVQAALDGMKEICIFNRKSERYKDLEKFADKLSASTDCKVALYPLEDEKQLYDTIDRSDILTNATPAGMIEHEDESIIKDPGVFTPSLLVADIIYEPRMTKLLKDASSRGCNVFNGMYMLLYQGAAAFHLWTGYDMPVDIIKNKYFRG